MISPTPLGPLDRRRLALAAFIAPATLTRALAGGPVRPATIARLQAGALALGLVLPAFRLAPAPPGRRRPVEPLAVELVAAAPPALPVAAEVWVWRCAVCERPTDRPGVCARCFR